MGELLHSMQQAASTMQRALDDLLNLNTVQTGRFECHNAPFSVRSLLRDIRHFAGVSFGGREFVCWIDADVPKRVVADRGRIRQLVSDTIRQAHVYSVNACMGVELVTLPHGEWVLAFTVWGLMLSDDFEERTLAKQEPVPLDETMRNMGWAPSRVHSPQNKASGGEPGVDAASIDAWNGGAAQNAFLSSTSASRSMSSAGEWSDGVSSGVGAISLVFCRALAEAMGGSMAVLDARHQIADQHDQTSADRGDGNDRALCVFVPVSKDDDLGTPRRTMSENYLTSPGLSVVVVAQSGAEKKPTPREESLQAPVSMDFGASGSTSTHMPGPVATTPSGVGPVLSYDAANQAEDEGANQGGAPSFGSQCGARASWRWCCPGESVS